YVNPSREIFQQMREGQMDLIHITVGYHEDFDGVLRNFAMWNRQIEDNADLVVRATCVADIHSAKAADKTALCFGLQNPLAFSADLARIEVLHQLGIKFCQLTYNQQSLLGAGCFEDRDSGITAFGREVIAEMNRIGMVIDLSHAGHDTAMQAVEISDRPVTVTHANPKQWHDCPRNLADDLINAVTSKGGMVGFSLYPHHMNNGSDCDMSDFGAMALDMVTRFGPNFGIGSDLCQNQPDSVVNWMRNGHWRKTPVPAAKFPTQPEWFTDNRDFPVMANGLTAAGLSDVQAASVLGDNWMRFLEKAWLPA
ncbi:MAG: membrane dipeptidase, partial [Planktomarina sp.]